jgi:hypothetical protein
VLWLSCARWGSKLNGFLERQCQGSVQHILCSFLSSLYLSLHIFISVVLISNQTKRGLALPGKAGAITFHVKSAFFNHVI